MLGKDVVALAGVVEIVVVSWEMRLDGSSAGGAEGLWECRSRSAARCRRGKQKMYIKSAVVLRRQRQLTMRRSTKAQ